MLIDAENTRKNSTFKIICIHSKSILTEQMIKKPNMLIIKKNQIERFSKNIKNVLFFNLNHDVVFS